MYRAAVDTVYTVSTPEAAELTKLLENIFRSVNIALIAVGGIGLETAEREQAETETKTKGRAKATPKKKAAAPTAEVAEEKSEPVAGEKAESPKKASRRRSRKETE